MNESNLLSEKLGVPIKNLDLFSMSLTHRSYLNEHPEVPSSNERLEFLGDAVLQFLCSELLYSKFPDSPEGLLTNLRAALVCTPSLAASTRDIGVREFLKLSKGEADSGGQEKDYILANTFEALLGAIYLDTGLGNCQKYLEKFLFSKLEEVVKSGSFKDYKSRLQEITQEKLAATPIYKELHSSGPDHNKHFVMGVYVRGALLSEGEGNSKQRAEQQAAKTAIEKF